MRQRIVSGLLLGLGFWGLTPAAHAEKLFSLSGRVALADGAAPDGVKVKLQVDLDRNGKLDSFETITGKVDKTGAYSIDYELNPQDLSLDLIKYASRVVSAYQQRGFDSLLDGGPLPVVLSFEREGYGTVVKRLNTLFESPYLDAALAPLTDVQCDRGSCLSTDGSVRFGEFPPGTKIARAYADAYDPSQETPLFPGTFTDSANNLLVSSGFAEVNMYQEDGTPVHQVGTPVKTRFEAKPASWATMPDLEPNSGRIELPMYSFDPATGEWVAEANGELHFADGRVVPEDDLSAIRDGSYGEQVFVDFETTHFSTFNCDAPITERACVKGTVVAKTSGKALAGVSVSVSGVTYTGTAGTLVTGADGSFATDVRKSELPNEDVDRNGQKGEVVEARVTVTGTGVFVGEAFETPTAQGSVGRASRPECKPADCGCLDLGTIEVEFEEPRLCDINVESLFSGMDVAGSGGPLLAGDAVVGATVRATLVGGVQAPQAQLATLCAGQACGSGVVDASGFASFTVPVIGDAPQIQVDASWSTEVDGKYHYYSGSRVVAGCSRKQSSAPDSVALSLDHSEVTGLGDFISSLGDIKLPGSSNNGGDDDAKSRLDDPLGGGCGCRAAHSSSHGNAAALAALAALFGVVRRRRRRMA